MGEVARRSGCRCLVLFLLLAGCGRAREDAASGVAVSNDPDGTRVVSGSLEDLATVPQWTFATEPRLEIGTREGEPGNDLFGVRSAFVLSDGRLVIANGGSAELRFYGPDGEYAGSVGGKGEGPGEFIAIQRADLLRGDSILVSDVRARRLSLFDSHGAFVSDVRLLPGADQAAFTISSGALEDGRVVTVSAPFRFAEGEMVLWRDTTTAVLHARDGTPVDTLARLPGTETVLIQTEGLATIVPRAFGRMGFEQASGSTIVFARNDSYELELRAADGAVSTRVRIAGAGCPTTEAEFDDWLDESFGREREVLRGRARELASSAPRYETHPAFQVLHIDRTGHVLVGRRACDGDRTDYSVFSPDGLPVAGFALDPDDRILDVGADFVVIRSRDELDREIVRLHALERSPN